MRKSTIAMVPTDIAKVAMWMHSKRGKDHSLLLSGLVEGSKAIWSTEFAVSACDVSGDRSINRLRRRSTTPPQAASLPHMGESNMMDGVGDMNMDMRWFVGLMAAVLHAQVFYAPK